jgi:hypothetical protein
MYTRSRLGGGKGGKVKQNGRKGMPSNPNEYRLKSIIKTMGSQKKLKEHIKNMKKKIEENEKFLNLVQREVNKMKLKMSRERFNIETGRGSNLRSNYNVNYNSRRRRGGNIETGNGVNNRNNYSLNHNTRMRRFNN